MNAVEFQKTVVGLVSASKYKISDHALDALIDDELERSDVADSIAESEIIEYYPEFGKGPAILLLQTATDERAIHCVWGIPKGVLDPAVLITAYIPDPMKWDDALKVRK